MLRPCHGRLALPADPNRAPRFGHRCRQWMSSNSRRPLRRLCAQQRRVSSTAVGRGRLAAPRRATATHAAAPLAHRVFGTAPPTGPSRSTPRSHLGRGTPPSRSAGICTPEGEGRGAHVLVCMCASMLGWQGRQLKEALVVQKQVVEKHAVEKHVVKKHMVQHHVVQKHGGHVG
eukprot:354946-Chlamydomonas_euryale.AAC.4